MDSNEKSEGKSRIELEIEMSEAKKLIFEVFEKWETFDSGVEEKDCPDCGIELSKKGRHEDWCWFDRAASWLVSNRVQVPSPV